MADTFDHWTMLGKGDIDPYIRAPYTDYCRQHSPSGSFVCTRGIGHTGLHVACYSDGRVCCKAWNPALPREMQLPEGF
jgi:hypothetical protein